MFEPGESAVCECFPPIYFFKLKRHRIEKVDSTARSVPFPGLWAPAQHLAASAVWLAAQAPSQVPRPPAHHGAPDRRTRRAVNLPGTLPRCPQRGHRRPLPGLREHGEGGWEPGASAARSQAPQLSAAPPALRCPGDVGSGTLETDTISHSDRA